MVSAENKSKKKRKDEKRELYSGWESCDADNEQNDENAFYGWQKSKRHEKCRYLDERNIVISPHLLTVKSWFSGSEGNEAETSYPRCHTSPDNTPSNKSPVVIPARPNELSQSTSDINSFQINTVSVHSVIHKQNSQSILDLKQSQPLLHWAPDTREQTSAEMLPWRCKRFAPMNCEAKPAEPPHLCKWPAAQRLEWCHESLNRLPHLGVQPPKDALPACRRRPGIQRPAVGHKGVQVHKRHVEKSHYWTSASKGLLNEDDTRPATLVDPCNQALDRCLWSTVQAEGEGEGCGKEVDQTKLEKDGGHVFYRNNASWLSDMPCSSGYHGNSIFSAMSHDITLFHLLQALPSKPANFPQVRGQRRLETLPSLNSILQKNV